MFAWCTLHSAGIREAAAGVCQAGGAEYAAGATDGQLVPVSPHQHHAA